MPLSPLYSELKTKPVYFRLPNVRAHLLLRNAVAYVAIAKNRLFLATHAPGAFCWLECH
jgi:hypothetical protein